MKILVIGGTRYFGIPMVEKLLRRGDQVSIATRGLAQDPFGSRVERIRLDLREEQSVRSALLGKRYDVVIDKMGYSSNEIRWVLESLDCDRFIHMSTAGVYQLDHFNIREEEFNGKVEKLVWCGRQELDYDSVKRNAECALAQLYNDRRWVSVRAPFVLGFHDYTKRLRFYVEHVLRREPMWVDNLHSRFCVAECKELSDFFVFLTDCSFTGAINACSEGLVSVGEILRYLEEKTGIPAVIDPAVAPAPYNGTKDNSLSTAKANALGFRFRDVSTWLPSLLDAYIDEVKKSCE